MARFTPDAEPPHKSQEKTIPGGNGRAPAESAAVYDSRTEAPRHSTAARLGKHYDPRFAASDNADKSPARNDDGHISSAEYWQQHRQNGQSGSGVSTRETRPGAYVDLDYRHPLEGYLATWWMQRLLGFLSKTRSSGKTLIEEVIESYANPHASRWTRMKYWLLHRFIARMKGGVSDETFRQRIAEHRSTLRGLVVTARSVAEFGLTVPQRFAAPLFAVWNFTNQCNLNCKHCYQDTDHQRPADELSLDEKLAFVDQVAEEYVPMIAFAGGEPTISRDLLPVLRRCQHYGIHTTIATHGGTMTPSLAEELVAAGVKYVEISLDSVHPERHDAFRGQPGMWHRTVRGMRYVAQQEGLRLGVAMCVHQGNYDEVEDMLQFAVDVGAGCFAHFNFIPVGRGLEMAQEDLTPAQREELLLTLNRWMQSGKIGVISTAPQLGKVCLAHAPADGKTAASHAGAGAGLKTRVIAKYLGACGAGRTYVAIEPNGDITPCVYLPHRVLGNIRQRNFRDIFRNNEFWDILCDRNQRLHHCEVCAYKNYCGGCRARADAYHGQLHAGDPGCLFNEKHWETLLAQGSGEEAAPASECTTVQ